MLDRTAVEALATPQDVAHLAFKTDGLSDHDVALIGVQRTKNISALSRKAYMDGDAAPLMQEAATRRDDILNGALVEIACEYHPVKTYLDTQGIKPKSLIDIGCGHALPDLFFQRDFKPRFTLVDIEHTDDQYHGWADSGSGYASLAAAKALLHANGAAKTKVATLNPLKEPGKLPGLSADMVHSFYSCGFHYPVDDYADLMVQTLENGGVICLDLRKRYLRRRPEPLARVLDAGKVHQLFEDPRSFRVMVQG